MASRRTRIKGLANIPQRRKAINGIKSEEEHTDDKVEVQKTSTVEDYNPTFNTHIDDLHSGSDSVSAPSNNLKLNETKNGITNQDTFKEPEAVHTKSPTTNNTIEATPLNENNKSNGISEIIQESNKNSTPEEKEKNESTIPKPSIRRKFIKPTVCINNVFNKRSKPPENLNNKPKDIITPSSEEKQIVPVTNEIDDTPIETKKEEKDLIVNNNIFSPPPRKFNEKEITLNETHFTAHNISPSNVYRPDIIPLERGPKRLTNFHHSDTEYPVPPSSPSKINRSRIKAVPRLSQRKTSFSASESEDESRRNYNRHRNDSVCSTTSTVHDNISIGECFSPQKPKEFNSVIQKKCRRTEQSRRLAEARRDFHLKFGASKPDKQKLTMMDLIFYNPTTNPMVYDNKQKKSDGESETIITDELEDDPSNTVPENDKNKSDEENEMPAPQIKIGPQGEIILDEQSLVIENKETKRHREEIQKSKMVDGDFDTGYGVYKRAKRSKDWSQPETLLFYKALNTIGTDFTLMCELFPKRSRRELKMKFKKEERVNKMLIDKAVMNPCNFDYAELKLEVDLEQKEQELLAQQKMEDKKLKHEKQERIRKRKHEESIKLAEMNKKLSDINKTTKEKQNKPARVKQPKKPKLNINSVLEDSDADDESDSDSLFEDDFRNKIQKPTRSGRVPKTTQKYESVSVRKVFQKSNYEENPENVEPGSIMIMTSMGENGEPVFKVYMVTPDNSATPVSLNSDDVMKVIKYKQNVVRAENILTISGGENVDAPEENVTIPVEENFTICHDSDPLQIENNVTICHDSDPLQNLENNVTISHDSELPVIVTDFTVRNDGEPPAPENNFTICCDVNENTQKTDNENRNIPNNTSNDSTNKNVPRENVDKKSNTMEE